MDDEIETLMVEVRASTQGFRSDIETMRGALDTTLVDGFAKAGNVLERGLLTAIRRGSLGFDDLKRVALQTLDQIAAQALRSGIGSLFSAPATAGTGIGGLLTGAIGSLFGLPGRATGAEVPRGAASWIETRTSRGVRPPASGSTRPAEVGTNNSGPRSPTR